MTFSVDVYGHSNSDFFGHNQTHQIQKHILSDKSNAHFVNTFSLYLHFRCQNGVTIIGKSATLSTLQQVPF